MPLVSEEQRAAAAVRACKLGMPIRQAAREWDVNRSYILRRLRGVPTRKETYAHLQALSTYYEQQLANWAIGQARLGFALSIVKFRLMAKRMLNVSSGNRSLGKK